MLYVEIFVLKREECKICEMETMLYQFVQHSSGSLDGNFDVKDTPHSGRPIVEKADEIMKILARTGT